MSRLPSIQQIDRWKTENRQNRIGPQCLHFKEKTHSHHILLSGSFHHSASPLELQALDVMVWINRLIHRTRRLALRLVGATATRNKCLATSNRCLTSSSKEASRNKCLTRSNKCLTTRNKDATRNKCIASRSERWSPGFCWALQTTWKRVM